MLAIAGGGAAVAQQADDSAQPAPAATGTPAVPELMPPEPPLVPQPAPAAENMVLRDGAVIKSDGAKVYVNRGQIHGVAVGMEMDVFNIEPIKDLDGKVLDQEEVITGRIRIAEVRPQISIGQALKGSVSFEPGYIVKYYAPADEKPSAARSAGRCPEGMLFDAGGAFFFVPSYPYASNEPAKQVAAETAPFCIDRDPVADPERWSDANTFCAKQGKRLCAREELQKVCVMWEKHKPCLPEMQVKGECETSQDTVTEFRKNQEWTADLISGAGAAAFEANSCACPGTSPVCTHCYYKECRGAKKYFRCCAAARDSEEVPPEDNGKRDK